MNKGKNVINTEIVKNDRYANPTHDEVFEAAKRCYAPRPLGLRLWLRLNGIDQRVDVRVAGVRYESGCPGMLLLEGLVPRAVDGHNYYTAFYNANTQTGWIKLLRTNEKP